MEEDEFRKAYEFMEEGYAEICRYCDHFEVDGGCFCVHPDLGEDEMQLEDVFGTCDAFDHPIKRSRDEWAKKRAEIFATHLRDFKDEMK